MANTAIKAKNSISLLVPCYNAEKYIKRFIEHLSTLNDEFDEVIFYNDGSKDSTLNILKGSEYKFISAESNNGPGYARNRLAAAAAADYIHFHDIDDEFNPDFIKLIKKEIATNQPDVIIGDADWIDAYKRNTLIEWRYDQIEIQSEPLSYFITHPLGIINTVYKRQSFLNIHGFNEQLHCWEDTDLHIKLAANNVKFAVIPQVIAYSLRHDAGISHNQEKCWNCRLKFLDTYIHMYSKSINKEVFKSEVKKVQAAFINMQTYDLLINIIRINKKYKLGIEITKIKCIYYLNKYFLPKYMIDKLLNKYRTYGIKK